MNEQPAPYLPPPTVNIHQTVKAPAIALIVTAILNFVSVIATIVVTAIGIENIIDPSMLDRFNLPPEFRQALEEGLYAEQGAIELTLTMGNYFLIAVISGFILFGGLSMLRLKHYGFALTAAILAILPCTYCCCPCMFFGIWALVVLLKPEVKYAFYHQEPAA